MDLGLSGKTVLITGASQGIGEGLALAFAQEGCNLKLVARSEAKLAETAQKASLLDVRADILPIDMTQAGAIDRIVQFAGPVDVLVNNAGAIPGGDLWDVDQRKWREGWELKVFGYIDLTRAIYRVMKERRAGVILNNIGNGGENPDFHYIAGSTGNAALMAFTRALGGRSLEDAVRVVGVNPGPVMTERIVKVLKLRANTLFGDESRYVELLESYPLGRAASVQEIADMFLFLASERSGYTSGTIVTIDGGISSKRSIV
jgi:NAD(P)-dependent dehydrogenase (short-subunit alcohol dehydrogenase family)